MIGFLKGKIEYIRNGRAVVSAGGVGYEVRLTSFALGKVSGQKDIGLFIHTHVREDAIELYGFLSREELDIFELLISVSGVGPRSAVGILSIADPKTIRTAILNEDPSILTKVSGVGRRTAERVIVELKNKVADLSVGEKEEVIADSDALEALSSMGYTVSESREALKSVPKEVKDVGERVKLALKNLGKK
jgi:holliday junction DNA helicase RuvA